MVSKWLMIIFVFLVPFLLNSDAVRRGGSSTSRVGSHSYSAGNLSNEAPQDPGRAILAIFFMALSCGGGIGWRMYRCYRKEKRRKFHQPPLPYPNNIHTNPMSTLAGDQSNEADLSKKRLTPVSLLVESLDCTSENLSQPNTLKQIQTTTNNEEKYVIIVPDEDMNKPSRTGWIDTLL